MARDDIDGALNCHKRSYIVRASNKSAVSVSMDANVQDVIVTAAVRPLPFHQHLIQYHGGFAMDHRSRVR